MGLQTSSELVSTPARPPRCGAWITIPPAAAACRSEREGSGPPSRAGRAADSPTGRPTVTRGSITVPTVTSVPGKPLSSPASRRQGGHGHVRRATVRPRARRAWPSRADSPDDPPQMITRRIYRHPASPTLVSEQGNSSKVPPFRKNGLLSAPAQQGTPTHPNIRPLLSPTRPAPSRSVPTPPRHGSIRSMEKLAPLSLKIGPCHDVTAGCYGKKDPGRASAPRYEGGSQMGTVWLNWSARGCLCWRVTSMRSHIQREAMRSVTGSV